MAHATHAQAWALTFHPHPLAILAPERCPPLLTSLELRLERLAEQAITGCLLLPFTEATALSDAESFIQSVFSPWITSHQPCAVIAGSNWRFGHHQRGSLATLCEWTHHRITTHEAPLVTHQNQLVCSSAIRHAIQCGNLSLATAMLGHPHTLRETVVQGRGIGHTLGFATANFHPTAEVLPPTGVYVIEALRKKAPSQGWIRGIANLGYCPTFTDAKIQKPVLEAHLFDLNESLYGETLDLHLLGRLRDEIHFPSKEALIQQIQHDIAQARAFPR